MTAQEFIKQYGWGKAKLVISEWNNYFNQYEVILMPTHYDSDLEIFVHADDFKNLDESDVCIKDLKQFVDAWELVQVHGLSKSKDIVDDSPSDDLYYSWLLGESGIKDKTVHIGTLRKAIELVESVNE